MFSQKSLLIVCALFFILPSCTEDTDPVVTDPGPYPDNPYAVWRNTLEIPEGSPVFNHPEPSDCGDATGDEAILECADKQFWRVLQRDKDDRKEFWHTMVALESQLSDNVDPLKKANLIFRRAQLAMTYSLEQEEDGQILLSMATDMTAAIELDPNQPSYVTWLDTVKIATADRLGQTESMLAALDEAWVNVENWTEETTRSTLVASLTGTTIGLSIDSGAPHRTMELLETFECHPKVLMENPNAICGRANDKRSCLEFCLGNSKKAPFGGPGFMYHIGEHYARMGDAEETKLMYELALTLPGADNWPFRTQIEEALADLSNHVARFTDLRDDETASYVVYANSDFACSVCHGSP